MSAEGKTHEKIVVLFCGSVCSGKAQGALGQLCSYCWPKAPFFKKVLLPLAGKPAQQT